jgi:hypothetical protein
MDQLSPAEKAEVEGYLTTYPELKTDLYEIGRSLELLAMSAARPAPPGLKTRILDELHKTTPGATSGTKLPDVRSTGMWGMIAAMLGMGLLVTSFFVWQKSKQVQQLEQALITQKDSCAQVSQELTSELNIFRQLTFRIIKYCISRPHRALLQQISTCTTMR